MYTRFFLLALFSNFRDQRRVSKKKFFTMSRSFVFITFQFSQDPPSSTSLPFFLERPSLQRNENTTSTVTAEGKSCYINRLFLRACFLTARSTDCTLGQTVFTARCDIPRAPMLKNPSGRCHLKKWIYTQSHRVYPSSVSKAQPSHSAAVFSSSFLPPSTPLPRPSPRRRHHRAPCRRHRRVAIAAPLPSRPQSQAGGN
jgi:hypothetical protein